MQLSDKQHGEILGAFISRLTLLDLERIIQASRKSWNATHNEGVAAQTVAQEVEQKFVQMAVGRMADYDKARISRILLDVVAQALPVVEAEGC